MTTTTNNFRMEGGNDDFEYDEGDSQFANKITQWNCRFCIVLVGAAHAARPSCRCCLLLCNHTFTTTALLLLSLLLGMCHQ